MTRAHIRLHIHVKQLTATRTFSRALFDRVRGTCQNPILQEGTASPTMSAITNMSLRPASRTPSVPGAVRVGVMLQHGLDKRAHAAVVRRC